LTSTYSKEALFPFPTSTKIAATHFQVPPARRGGYYRPIEDHWFRDSKLKICSSFCHISREIQGPFLHPLFLDDRFITSMASGSPLVLTKARIASPACVFLSVYSVSSKPQLNSLSTNASPSTPVDSNTALLLPLEVVTMA
jgi:hypothetical protein